MCSILLQKLIIVNVGAVRDMVSSLASQWFQHLDQTLNYLRYPLNLKIDIWIHYDV